MNKFLILLLFLFFGMFFTISAEPNKKSIKEYLGLSAEQDQKMKDLSIMCRTEDSICFAKLDELRKELFTEAGNDNPSADKINEIAEEIGLQHSMLSLCMANQVRVMKTILTKEQFEKFINVHQNKFKRPIPNKPPR